MRGFFYKYTKHHGFDMSTSDEELDENWEDMSSNASSPSEPPKIITKVKRENLSQNPYRRWIYLARAIDAWRPFPRLFISLYIYLLYSVVTWYLALPDPTMEQSGLISIIVGAGAAWFGLYVNSGGGKE
jgi:hypothetical protein